MESITQSSELESKYILPCMGGLFIPVIATVLCRPFDLSESFFGTIVLLLLFLLVGFISITRGASSKKRVFFLVLLCLPIGVIINIVVDSYIWNIDHNLFPFEFLIVKPLRDTLSDNIVIIVSWFSPFIIVLFLSCPIIFICLSINIVSLYNPG